MPKSFWERGEEYAKKVSTEIIEQINAGVAPWQKPWKPGEHNSPETFPRLRPLHRPKRDEHPKRIKDPSQGSERTDG